MARHFGLGMLLIDHLGERVKTPVGTERVLPGRERERYCDTGREHSMLLAEGRSELVAVNPWFGDQFSLKALFSDIKPRAGLVLHGSAAQPAQPSAARWGFAQV